jgi:hypothetical protein
VSIGAPVHKLRRRYCSFASLSLLSDALAVDEVAQTRFHSAGGGVFEVQFPDVNSVLATAEPLSGSG